MPYHKIKDQNLFKIYASPWYWKHKAETLRNSAITLHHADLIYQDQLNKIIELPDNERGDALDKLGFGNGSVSEALMGFSIECLLKGVIISKNPEITEHGKIIHLNSHDLLKLSKDADLCWEIEELNFLRIAIIDMQEYRYPMPNKIEHTNKDNIWIGERNFYDLYNSIFQKLSSMIGGYNMFGHDESSC